MTTQAPTPISGTGSDVPYPVPQEGSFGGEKFLPADDIAEIARHLIGTVPELRAAGNWDISFLWKAKGGQKAGRGTYGKCVKVGGLLSAFTKSSFVVWLAADHARVLRLTGRQIEALTFHELSHISEEEDEDGNVTPTTIGHDFEEFAAVVRRYGPYLQDLRMAKHAFEQLPLFDPDTGAPTNGKASEGLAE